MWIRIFLLVTIAIGINWAISEQMKKKQSSVYAIEKTDVSKKIVLREDAYKQRGYKNTKLL